MNPMVVTHRLKAEYKEMSDYPQFSVEIDNSNKLIWYVSFKGEDNTLYANEKFKIKFEFTPKYVIKLFNIKLQPIQKPAVTFVENIPINPYVFSNGLICSNILDTEWTPVLRVSTVSLCVLNLLSSTTEKKKPINDEEVCKSGCKNFNKGKWIHNYQNI